MPGITDVCKENPCPDKSVVHFLQSVHGTELQHPSGEAGWKVAADQKAGKRLLLLPARCKTEVK